MAENWITQLTDTVGKRRVFEQELAVSNATEMLARVMEERGVSKAELARLMGTSRANVTSLLSGRRNMTVRTLADVAAILGVRVNLACEALRSGAFIVAEPPQRLTRPVHNSTAEVKEAAAAASSVASSTDATPLAA
jgi:transcriptional regulator with XRE-family HTH domain